MNPTQLFIAESQEVIDKSRREGVVVFDDGPYERLVQALCSDLDEEIEQAGGVDLWREKQEVITR
ncbi:hypothetical protein FNU76_13475 [Chitinimonas arctica]|uniref:Uncharacterized protein n=1 Tax=Chitinimonas arctica TaxID=2594795 RepID=A0A516SGN5_9NEIS|nr:hypothetical protein [Chitinimonas arctica]QDQ27292.1 hypothetical protein FNU76_13475 [Chitinimonas arctica]